jgi:release factor glutamine methyltransferase
MAKIKSLHDLFVHELRDLYSAEKQLLKALPKMAKAAIHEELKEGFEEHLKQTEEHVSRLEEIFEKLEVSSRGEKCVAMEGLIEEGKKMLEEDIDDNVLDAALIASAQRIEHLLAHVLGLKRMELYLQFDRPLSDAQLEPLRDLVKRRAAREPLQHLLGTVEFLGRTFGCDKRALIPRPETEQLCEMLIEAYKAEAFRGRAIDLGTGSGVIALTLAGVWPGATVEAVDLSPEALALAQENAARLGLTERVRLYSGDLLAQSQGEFQLMVANLPYIAAEEVAGLSPEVQRDPHRALVGGPAGTELVFRLIREATAHLRGQLALEIGLGQADAVSAELQNSNYRDIKVASDYQGVRRFVFATYG